MYRRTLLQAISLTSLAGFVGCGPATPEPHGPSAAQGGPRDAHTRAANVVGARVTLIVFMDRVRVHPLAPQLAGLDVVAEAFEGTDIDPIKDVDRAVMAAKTARSQEDAIAVAEHHVAPDRLKVAMTQMVARSGGQGRWLTDYDFPTVAVMVRERQTVVMAVTPKLLVVTSPKHAKKAASLRQSGGVPDPVNAAAIVADAHQPASSLKARGVPPVPKTVNHLYADLTLRDDGGADLVIDGKSTSPAQARADATQLTADVEKASTVNIAFFKIKAFEPIVFKPDGDMVFARRRITQKELNTLLSLAAMMIG